MTPTRFPRTARVRAGSDFDRIFQHGRRVALPVLDPAEPQGGFLAWLDRVLTD